jgi:hypothetical protein
MTNTLKWSSIGLLLAAVFVMGMMRTPQDVYQNLLSIAGRFSTLSLIIHLVMLAALILGFLLPQRRALIFAGIMALLAGSAAIVGAINLIPPNIVAFGLYFVLILTAQAKGQLSWDLSELTRADWFFGLVGLIFGFWYLHWVESPIMLNALIFSPLGVLNCPTIVSISGLLCLSNKRPPVLEFTTGLVGVYFGFYGIMRLGAYVDVTLVMCGLYQLVRFGSAVWPKR